MYKSMLWVEEKRLSDFYDTINSTNKINHPENLKIHNKK